MDQNRLEFWLFRLRWHLTAEEKGIIAFSPNFVLIANDAVRSCVHIVAKLLLYKLLRKQMQMQVCIIIFLTESQGGRMVCIISIDLLLREVMNLISAVEKPHQWVHFGSSLKIRKTRKDGFGKKRELQ